MKTQTNTSPAEVIYQVGKSVGPMVPTIGFWFRKQFLGEVRYLSYGDQSNKVYQCMTKLAQQLRFLGMYSELEKLYSAERTFKVYY